LNPRMNYPHCHFFAFVSFFLLFHYPPFFYPYFFLNLICTSLLISCLVCKVQSFVSFIIELLKFCCQLSLHIEKLNK
jgi:hypothetical protein